MLQRLLLQLLLYAGLACCCETGLAFEAQLLSVTSSLSNNADVALLKSYNASDMRQCITECCNGRYGSCTVASFKSNTTTTNCLHFNCRPVHKCKFDSSNQTTSFSFSDTPAASTATTSTVKSSLQHLSQETSTISAEQSLPKDDNTAIKPRKGVESMDSSLENATKSGVKPRKGAPTYAINQKESTYVNVTKSNVKPRKGVEHFEVSSSTTANSTVEKLSTLSSLPTPSVATPIRIPEVSAVTAEDIISALKHVFEDDLPESNTTLSASLSSNTIMPSESGTFTSTISVSTVSMPILPSKYVVSAAVEEKSEHSNSAELFVKNTPSPTKDTILMHTMVISHPNDEVLEIPVLESGKTLIDPERVKYVVQLPKDLQGKPEVGLYSPHNEDEDLVKIKKYNSSVHLILYLVFGLFVLCTVLGLVAKRVYDNWSRKDYFRMNYLIDGVYNADGLN